MVSSNNLTDSELLAAISKRDTEALSILYERYSPLLYTLIKKIVAEDKVAETILVEVFDIIWKRIDLFNFETNDAFAWLVTLTRNRAVDSIRRGRSSASTSEFYNEDYEESFIIPYLSKEIDSLNISTVMKIKPAFEAALEGLTDAQKYVIHLAYYDGYTLNEISEKLHIPVETVRSKVMTALFNLRDNLGSG